MSKILLIDDNADNLTSLSATIKGLIPSTSILTALSGQEGLEIASEELPDVIILDIRMPGMDGYEVLGLLKANVKTKIIPVILLTANYTDIKSKIRGLEAGADAFLSKPIDNNELIAQIKVMQRIKKAEDLLRRENILLESVAKDASKKFDFTQRKYQNVFDNNIAGIVETTFDGKIINCNTALAKIFGYKNIEEVLTLKTIPFYKNKSDREKIISSLKKDNELLNYEIDFVDKNGKTVNALIRCFNINNESVLTFLVDITDVKKLQETQRQYEHIVSSSTDMMALLDKNFTYLACNSAYHEAFGKTSEKLIGFTVEDVFGKEFFEEVIKPNAVRCLSGEVINYQEWFSFPAKGKCYMDVSYFPYKDSQNKIKGFVVNARDITDKKRIEEGLKMREQQLSLIYESTGDILYYLKVEPGPNYRFLTVNNAFLKSTGLSLEQIVGKTINEVIPKPSLNLVHSNYRKAIREKRIVYWEETSRYPAGLKTGIVSIAPIFDDNGNCTHLVGSVHDITERKQAEDKLRKNEFLLRKAQKVANLGSFELDIQSGNWNSSAVLDDIFGIDENYNKNIDGWSQILHPKEREEVLTYFQNNVLTEHQNFNREYRIIRISDNEERWVHGIGELEFDADGNPVKMIGTIQDITERKKAERELRESYNIINRSPAVIFLWKNAEGWPIEYVSVNVKNLFGYTAEEFLSGDVSYSSVVQQDDLRKAIEKTALYKEDKKRSEYTQEYRIIAKDGKIKWVEDHTYIRRNEKGEITHYQGIVLDITDRKKAEEKLRYTLKELDVSEKRLKTIIETEPECVKILSTNGKLLDMNRAGLDMIEADSLEQVTGWDILSIVVPEYREAFREMIKSVIRGNKEILVFKIIGLKGTHRWLETYSVPLYNAENEIIELLSVTRDITERKINEEKIRQKNKQLILLSKASTEINKVLDIETILQQLVKIAVELTGSTSGAAALYEDNKMVFKTYNNEGKVIPIDFKFEKGSGVPGWIIITKEPYITNDAKNDEHVIPEIREELNFHQLIDVPVLNKRGELLGCFEIHNTKDNRLYDENDIEILKGLAANTAVAIENAQMLLERKKAEEKLTASEEKYRTLFENNLAGVYVATKDGKILDCNEAFIKMMGYSTKEEVLKTDASDFHPNITEREIFLKKLNAKKELINFESKAMKKDGSYIYIIENVQLLGENILQGTVIDITDRKKAEESLITTIKFNESLIETIPFGLDIVDLEGNILFMNNLLKDAVGQETPKGKCWELYKDNEKQCTECPLKEEMELGDTNICEVHNVFGGREYEVTHTVMNYKNQKALLEIFRDVTESRKSQKEILKLSRCVEQSPAMIVITDTEGNIEFINPKVTEITGYTKEELIGRKTSIFKSGKTPTITYEELWDTILKGDTWEGEIINKRKNGEEYWEATRISPIFNDRGETINFIGIKEDITEKIKARNELIEAKEKAEEMNKIKSNFLANMSHELRTPLVGILGFTEILTGAIDDPDLKEYTVMINEAGQRLLETLNLILNLSKIESELIEVELMNINVMKTIQRAVGLFEAMASNKNIYLKLESDIEKLNFMVDERMLFQIVNNLVNNAVKFTKEGGVTIKVSKIKNDSYLKIQVKDTGIGIPKEKQNIIWQEFRQVSEGTARMFEGTGLGLTVTNEFTHKLGGEIKLESKVGVGSTFTVLLPINRTKEKAESNKQTTPPRIKHIEEKKKLSSVLYLEDDKNARSVVSIFLRKICAVDLASTVEEGLDKAVNKKYDLFLVDINLKLKKGGIEFLNEIKKIKKYKGIPLIAVTAYTMVDDEKKFLDIGFADYISKPFSKNKLIQTIDNYI